MKRPVALSLFGVEEIGALLEACEPDELMVMPPIVDPEKNTLADLADALVSAGLAERTIEGTVQ